MKNNNMRIAVIEEGNFYNRMIENHVFDLCLEKQYNSLNCRIKSFNDIEAFKGDKRTVYNAILFNNYFKSGKKGVGGNIPAIIEETKRKNDSCLFISVSGYAEMLITAEFYKEGELQFFFSKQSNLRNENPEESCSIPAIYKIMDKFINAFQEKALKIGQELIGQKMKISA